ncbi:MAG: urea carboxylase-associated family protein [Reyranellaceae bacterium]
MTAPEIEIPARRGKAAVMTAGQTVTVINTHGEQVVDTWAFSRADLSELLSMEHTRAHTLHLVPRPGDVLRSNRRRPMLTVLEDTSGGIHDTLMAACDRHRYALLGVEGYHDNCTDNLHAALAELGLVPPEVPSPLNLFMNIPWAADGGLQFAAPPRPVPGGHVRLRAEMDLVIAFSACPQDIVPINGVANRPVEAHFSIE